MNDELHNGQSNQMQTNSCNVCKKDPCVCPDRDDKSPGKTSSENSKNDEGITKTKPPKISWI